MQAIYQAPSGHEEGAKEEICERWGMGRSKRWGLFLLVHLISSYGNKKIIGGMSRGPSAYLPKPSKPSNIG